MILLAALSIAAPIAYAQMSGGQAMQRLQAKEKQPLAETRPATAPVQKTSPSPATSPATASMDIEPADGSKYPKAEEVKTKFEKLPSQAAALGQPPAALVGNAKVYSAEKDTPKFEKYFEQIQSIYSTGGDCRRHDFQYIAVDVPQTELVGFDMQNGRITRIGYYFSKLSTSATAPLFQQWNKLRDKDMNELVESECRLYAYEERSYMSAGDKNSSAIVIFEVDPADWYLLYHPDTPADIIHGMRHRQLVPGMTREEADATMRRDLCKDVSLLHGGRLRVVTYYKFAFTNVPEVRAWFEDGKITKLVIPSRGKAAPAISHGVSGDAPPR